MDRTSESFRPLASSSLRRPALTRDDVLDVGEIAELLHLPLSTALEYARRAVIPGHKLGRRWIFLRDEIELAVRAAPGHARTNKRSRPPGSQPRKLTSKGVKRYPETVPATPSGAQATLFD